MQECKHLSRGFDRSPFNSQLSDQTPCVGHGSLHLQESSFEATYAHGLDVPPSIFAGFGDQLLADSKVDNCLSKQPNNLPNK
jgi:hypothetical protein